MAWEVNQLDAHSIIEVKYTDTVSGAELREATVERIARQYATGYLRVLINASSIRLTASATDLYDLADKIYTEHEAPRNSHVAVVVVENDRTKEMAQFYKDATTNRGWRVETFSDYDTAVSWLTSRTAQFSPSGK